ncbi:MAG: TlpA disulfide reductase family protein [Bacteroidota bacterium]
MLLLFLLAPYFFSCGEHKVEEINLAETSVEVVKEKKPVMAGGKEIVSYDYDAFDLAFLQQEDDKIYVLNFWATWCKPCIKELPAFERLNAQYKDQNVEVVLVSLDFPQKLESAVVPFVNKKELKSKVILLDDDDSNRWIPLVDETWSGAIPVTLMVKNGERKFYERPFTFEELEIELKTIL